MSLAVSRVSVLSDLVTCGKPIDVLAATMSDLGWSETPMVVLTTDHILSVLRRFQSGELTAADVEAWADLIECREDIDYQPDRHEDILEAIYVLANPVLNGPLDEALTDQVIASLSA
ncbi:MAG: hypothetical protein EOS58_22490 [Mesorhizobium sp.]|uniref:hypothetical protein n=1 Tax=unclassified Mesorhizobium TaxID=325217 RepID=UPI000F7624F8|nr:MULTISPECIES: hypothetical protein [unclassified Mesorhizobium]RVD72400.1 hypothetical protein EN751_10255 [Mesorhizobium sp. M4A.F.Ca.ET.029.04.2.1]AZO46597.1 hypothetical protein EJ073_01360 [Mesorhizobium sp. M4B.F.Ca.ET.058.02.1.1]RUX44623.1 hypothetical protein EOA33_26245 [Mesorhizobium sp. M4A.F.Ca.ET.050.02.1.1]RVC43515.1 hypothetical protein EN781_17875 [Mesorhizobium sp. M4A.F.Ca.ET.090.04.2.1]RVC78981.1 hypothetical protein EN745_17345 [Mesorhizobium sp. M4A.F.Ca.ET.022.05.2.1]